MNKTITIMADNNAPEYYWEQAIDTAVYLLNRSPIKKLNWKTPFELIMKEKPDISHLVPFYSKGYYHLTKEERKNTLSQKAKECRMVGYYPYGKNQYKILVGVNSIINRRDVIFDEIPQEVGQSDSETETIIKN